MLNWVYKDILILICCVLILVVFGVDISIVILIE